MYFLVMFVHVVVCIFLIIVVLLQSGKAADLAGAFGGMGSQTAFGPRGSATLLSKATTISAVLFMVTSLSLSILATRNAGLGTSVLETAPQKSAPAQVPVSVPVQTQAPAPPGGMIPINVTPQPGDKPGEMKIDLKDLKLPPNPATPPAGQKSAPPATKK
jgi:preprotein translocase subunit SecG